LADTIARVAAEQELKLRQNEELHTNLDAAKLVAGRNKRSVWTVATEPYPEAHFATFPEKLIEPMILAGRARSAAGRRSRRARPVRRIRTSTVAVVAQRLGRRAVLVDLSPEYVEQMIRRIGAARGAGEGPALDMPVPFADDGLWAAEGLG
jgi:DNA modification methylase